jgi:hypothetical protein
MTYSTVFENIEARAVIAEIRNGFGLSRYNFSREDFVNSRFSNWGYRQPRWVLS